MSHTPPPSIPPDARPPRSVPPFAIPLGEFEFSHQLGRGAQSQVWAGVHRFSGLPVAAKVLTARFACDPVYLSAFRNEVRSAARLQHPSIVMVYSHGVVGAEAEAASAGRLRASCPYLVMERAGAGTLRHQLGRLPWPRIQELLLSLLSALAHAHARDVIHRDIKPGNVLLTTLEAPPKLADFGLAHPVELERLSALDEVFAGTPPYMAPEQLDGRWRDYGPWTDLYGLGCLAFALASGRPPFGHGKLAEDLVAAHLHGDIPRLRPRVSVPSGFEVWVRRLLEKDPARRCRRAADAARALRLLASDPTGVTGRISTLPSRTESVQRRPPLPLASLGMFGLRPIPVLGRTDEQAVLWATLREVAEARRTRFILLEGSAGTGKTHLARWLCERAHETGAATVLTAVHSAIPASPDGLGRMLRRHLRCGDLDRDGVEARVTRLLAESGVRDPLESRALTDLVGPAGRDANAAATIRLEGAEERHALVRNHLLRLCRERPVIVRLEDVGWSLDSLAFTRTVLTSPGRRSSPILVLATATPESLAENPDAAALVDELLALEEATRLPLGPLSDAAARTLLRDILGLESELAARVAERTEGNPMFAVQLVRNWLVRGVLERTEGGLRLRPGMDAMLSDDLREVWAPDA